MEYIKLFWEGAPEGEPAASYTKWTPAMSDWPE